MPALTPDDVMAVFAETFPQAEAMGFTVEAITEEGAEVRLEPDERHLRPGGTISGPTLMTLADTVAYVALLGRFGPEVLAVTSSLEMHFLRRPPMAPITSSARLLKAGRRLVVSTVEIRVEGVEGPVAHATVTYARAGEAPGAGAAQG